MRHDADLGEAELPDELAHVGGQRAFVVTGERLPGVAETTQVGRDHREPLGERGNDLAPLVPALWPAVQQHERGAGAGEDVVHAKSVDHANVMGPGLCHDSPPRRRVAAV